MGDLANYYSPKILGELAVGYGGQRFIGARALPIVQTPDQTGQFQTFDQSNMVLDIASARVSPTSDVAYVDQGVAKTDYAVKGYSYKRFVPNALDEDIAGQYLAAGIHRIMGGLLRIRESLALTLIQASGNSTAVSTKWDASGANLGTVAAGVEEMQATVSAASGQRGNVLIMGQDVWAIVAQHLVGAYGLAPTAPSTAVLADVLGLSEVLVAEASYVTKESPLGTFDSPTAMWTAGNVALISNGVPNSRDFVGDLDSTEFTPSYGKIVQWVNGSLMNGIEWRSYENPFKGSHGGVDVQGIMYLDAIETLNDANTIADVTT